MIMSSDLTTSLEEKQITPSTVYIDEAGNLGYQKGTQWFVLASVVVDKKEEPELRHKIEIIRERLNVREIHMRKLRDYNQRAFVVDMLAEGAFTYMAVLVDTQKLGLTMRATASIAYNYTCRMLLERVSWFLRDTKRVGDIVLSARGTGRDEELIRYISEKLITGTYPGARLAQNVFKRISAKPASSWDMLQLADVCATSMFWSHEINTWRLRTPCFERRLRSHLYKHGKDTLNYGVKYFDKTMTPNKEEMNATCLCEKERTPGTTTT